MQIGVISDTHGDSGSWRSCVEEFKKEQVELILHAGDILAPGPKNPISATYNPIELINLINSSDIPLLISRGNCDASVDAALINLPIQAPYVFLQVEDLRILLCHGDTFISKEQRLSFAAKYKLNILISGHTHIPHLYEEENIIFLNPGSPAVPLSEEGYLSCAFLKYKKEKKSSFLYIKIKDIKKNIIIKEYKKEE